MKTYTQEEIGNLARDRFPLNLHEGRRLRNRGASQVAAKNAEFMQTMRNAAFNIAKQFGTVTSDDLRLWADDFNIAPTHPNAFGAVFTNNKDLEPCGFCPSAQPNRRGGLIRVWRIRNHDND